jgi:hypothetical protein
VYVTQPVVVQPTVVYNQANLTSSCSASVTYNNGTGVANVVWRANPSGGNGYYSYSWTGTDGLTSSYKDAYYNYSTSGTKYASVNITSGGHTITVNCTPVNINYPQTQFYQTVYQQPVKKGRIANRLGARYKETLRERRVKLVTRAVLISTIL